MSKLNPQNATAYVGPGVLRKGGKITPVPNGPLIKKKGPFKGSTLKAGGKIKKAMVGAIMGMSGGKDNPIYKKTTDLRGKLGSAALGMPGMKPIVKNGSKIKKAQNGKTWQQMSQGEKGAKKQELIGKGGIERFNKYKDSVSTDATNRVNAAFEKNAAVRGMTVDQLRKDNKKPNISIEGLNDGKSEKSSSKGGPAKAPCKGGVCTGLNKSKNGSMLKRADGSMSRRGLYDNIRANKGSGKKPTPAMLKQERKIKAKK